MIDICKYLTEELGRKPTPDEHEIALAEVDEAVKERLLSLVVDFTKDEAIFLRRSWHDPRAYWGINGWVPIHAAKIYHHKDATLSGTWVEYVRKPF